MSEIYMTTEIEVRKISDLRPLLIRADGRVLCGHGRM